ncbi:MAG: L-glutamate gamma-semialdehyde dehydrogenase [Pseudomonadota bacterium]
MPSEFRNEALTDFSKPDNKKKMGEALALVAGELGREYPLVIGGSKVLCREKIRSTNPADQSQVVGIVQKGTRKEAIEAIDAAWAAFETWKSASVELRADYLFRIAAKMRERKFELASWMIFEIGKSWGEADGDVAEAIDFCEFYGREAIRLGGSHPCLPWPGETNETVYIPLGAGAVVPPWNFPLAILVGMTTAAVAAGNTVVLKPASDTPVIAAKFMEITEEVKLPPGVVNFVSGSGADAGEEMVANPRIRFISFTGSREVGLHITEEAARPREGQRWIKRVIAEMGGKDAIIVDSEADFEAAVEGVAVSAFGFQGQKCSACSRAIVDEKIYDAFIEALKNRVEKIAVGPTGDPANWMGPVSSKSAYDKVKNYIETGRREGQLVCGGEYSDKAGFFIQPTVFADILPSARLAQEEIFGPVLSVIRAKDFDEAISIFNGTDYGLTGGVFTKNPAKISRAKAECFCGNFYINRKITGALVGVQPFGGYNLSGTCSKAGGSDYLLLFLQAKSICEKTQ